MVENCDFSYPLHSTPPLESLRRIIAVPFGLEMNGSASISHLNKLCKLNNKLLRILQRRDLCTGTEELYKTYNTLPVTRLYVMQILVFVHKFYYHRETLPEIFANYFASNNVIHSYKTRNENMLHLFLVASSYGRRAVQFKGGTLWNNLMSLGTFKVKIKQYLLTSLSS